MREIILDTETTGLDSEGIDRIIEIGMVEHVDGMRTENQYSSYVNPEKEISAESQKVHGIKDRDLVDEPKFSEIVDDILTFIGNDTLVIHNANFDLAFINKELRLAHKIPISTNRVFDTLKFAQSTLPGRAKHNLDSLCNYYKIDRSRRHHHGALLDAELLSDVYLALLRDNNKGDMIDKIFHDTVIRSSNEKKSKYRRPEPLKSSLTEEDIQRHADYVKTTLGSSATWYKYGLYLSSLHDNS